MKKYLWIILVVAALTILVMVLTTNKSGEYVPSPTLSLSPIATKASATSVTKQVAGGVTVQSDIKTYSQLVNEYEGRRIQFDNQCQFSPSEFTFKNGTKIMLDNRSANQHTVSVGGNDYVFSAYGYRLLTLTGINLPQTLNVNCDRLVNVARIIIQN